MDLTQEQQDALAAHGFVRDKLSSYWVKRNDLDKVIAIVQYLTSQRLWMVTGDVQPYTGPCPVVLVTRAILEGVVWD
jgi:hypothetical protein